MRWGELRTELNRAGLVQMGALHEAGDTLVLVGTDQHAWHQFTQSAEYRDDAPDPLDRWSKRVLGTIGKTLDAVDTVFPSDGPPYPPFIRWALGTGRFWSSPVGMLVHDRQGLMFSLRGALRFTGCLEIPASSSPNPCDSCAERPCQTACPVDALTATEPYDVEGCKSYLRTDRGARCVDTGCLARQVCPASQVAMRPAKQSAFHMRAFLGR